MYRRNSVIYLNSWSLRENTRIEGNMKYLITILSSVIISVITIGLILYFFPYLLIAIAPSENWWTALSIIVAINFGVIGISFYVLHREYQSTKKLASIENNLASLKGNLASLDDNLEKYSTDYKEAHENIINIISNIFEVQNVSETKNHENWEIICSSYLNSDKYHEFLKPQTLRAWSTIAWKQGHIDIAILLREEAYKLEPKDFLNRVMLCSILTQEEKPDNTKIENILNNTDLNSDNITNENRDHFYNIQGSWHKKNGKLEEASESFKKAMQANTQTMPFNEYILTLIMREEVDNIFIMEEIERLENIPNSKWLDDTVLHQKAFRLFVNGFINKSKIDVFYKYLTPLMISELVSIYNNEYTKLMFFNSYSQILARTFIRSSLPRFVLGSNSIWYRVYSI